jgi:hypothetical protein
MDPNETLRLLREAITGYDEAALSSADAANAAAERIIELFEALDGWLSKGGFAPADWIADLNTRPPIMQTRDAHNRERARERLDFYAACERAVTSNVLAFAPNAVTYTVGVSEWDNGYWYDQCHVVATLTDGRHASIAFDEDDELADPTPGVSVALVREALTELSERDGPLGRHDALSVNIIKEN